MRLFFVFFPKGLLLEALLQPREHDLGYVCTYALMYVSFPKWWCRPDQIDLTKAMLVGRINPSVQIKDVENNVQSEDYMTTFRWDMDCCLFSV